MSDGPGMGVGAPKEAAEMRGREGGREGEREGRRV